MSVREKMGADVEQAAVVLRRDLVGEAVAEVQGGRVHVLAPAPKGLGDPAGRRPIDRVIASFSKS
jgi:hypothetical protein